MTLLMTVGLALTIAGTTNGQVKLSAIVEGKSAGEASLTQRVMPDGSKRVQILLELKGSDGRTVKVVSDSTYDPQGAPRRKFLETTQDRSPKRRTLVVTFDSEGAKVVEEVDGKRTIKSVPLVKTAPRENPSEFWFLRDTPQPGARVRYYRFDMDEQAWVLSNTRYVGPKTFLFGKQRVTVHEVVDDRVTALLDDQGLPYRLELPGVVFERKLGGEALPGSPPA